eukprot:2869828-Pleurochrysis_carterae.AAC.2
MSNAASASGFRQGSAAAFEALADMLGRATQYEQTRQTGGTHKSPNPSFVYGENKSESQS